MSNSKDVQRKLTAAPGGDQTVQKLTFDRTTGKLMRVKKSENIDTVIHSVMYICDMTADSNSTNKPQDRLKRLLKCSICLEIFHDPRTLICLHSFCKKCLENFVKDKSLDDLYCPVCRAKFTLNEGGVAGMTRNHFICSMVELMSTQNGNKSIPCTHCQEPSVGRCVTCELFMCEICFKPHNDYPGFQDHDVLTMEELLKPENLSKIKNSSKCKRHQKKKLKYYCETCDELICRHCMDFDHDKQHKFAPLEQAAKSKRERLKTDCETLERTIEERNKQTRVLTGVRQSLNSNFKKAQRTINEREDKLSAKLRGRLQRKTYSMIEETRRTFERKMELMNTSIDEAESLVNRAKASSDMARLLQDANDEEIVRSYKLIRKNVEKAREKRDFTLKDNVVMSWNLHEIDTMLLAEIKDVVEDENHDIEDEDVEDYDTDDEDKEVVAKPYFHITIA